MEKPIKIGIIKGKGTGDELSVVFKNFINQLNKKLKLQIVFKELDVEIETYWSLHKKDIKFIKRKTDEDILKLNKIFSSFFKEVDVVFRTGINAESLYSIRQKYNAIKVFHIPLKKSKIIVVRDQMQGFYANTSYKSFNNKLSFTGEFSKNNLKRIIDFSKNIANYSFKNQEYNIIAIYKYHIFGNIIENWVSSIDSEIKLYQPDTGISKLINELQHLQKNTVLIVSNEVGDILYEFLIEHFELGKKNELFTKNYYFLERKTLQVYQTVHGSADDIAGKGIINPFATIKIAAEILSSSIKDTNIIKIIDNNINKLYQEKIITPDVGGEFSTKFVLDKLTKYILNEL